MRRTLNGSPGLWTAPNSEMAPPGALRRALGVVITRPGIIEKARPYRQYGVAADSPTFSGTMAGLFKFGPQLLQYNTIGTLWTETSGGASGVFVACSGLPCNPPSAARYVRTVEAAGNVYLATSGGITKLDVIGGGGPTNSVNYIAGVPRALDVQLTLVASGTLLASTNSVGYRIVFGLQDANQNLIIGPPSGRAIATGTAAQNVTAKGFIPKSITSAPNATSYFVQVYRTAVNTVAGTDPGEEMQLVYQAFLTSTDISNKFISFTDATPDNLRGPSGYFVPSQDGIAEANYQPPIACDLALFKGTTFFANTVNKYRLRVQLTGVSANLLTISTAAGGITKSGGNGVYTFTGSPDLTNIPTDGTAKLSSAGNTSAGNNGEFVITAVNTGAFTITVTNAGAVTEPGLAGSRGWPSKLTIAGVNYYGSINGTETAGSQIFKVATAGTASQNVTDTCASLLRVVNQQAVPVVYGFYESGPDDGAGKMSFEEVAIGGSSFSIAASGTLLYNSFNPTIPVASPLSAQNDTAAHRLYMSKPDQPEHVPLANYFDIGARNKAILRIVALRDALLVFKEDGLFRVTGDGANFNVSLFDASVLPPVASQTTAIIKPGDRIVAVLRNRAYYLSLNGAMSISESSVSPIDTTVSNALRMYIEGGGSPRLTISVSEIDNTAYFYMNAGSFLTTDRCLAYSVSTQTWTEMNQTTSVTDGVAGQLAFATMPSVSLNGIIYRQAPGGSIFAQDTVNNAVATAAGWVTAAQPTQAHKYALNVSASNVGAFTITATADLFTPVVGSVVENSATGGLWTVTLVAGTTYTLAPLMGDSSFAWNHVSKAAYVYAANPITVEWVPFSAGDDASYARFAEASVLLDGISTATACTVNMYTEATTTTQTVNMTVANTPLPTGVSTQTLVRSLVPSNMQTARRLSVVFNHSNVNEFVFLRGVSYEFERMDGNELT